MGLVSATGLLVAGCSPAPCDAKCPKATFDLAGLSDSTVVWSIQGSPPQTIGVVPYPSSSSDCTFDQVWGSIYPAGQTGADDVLSGYFSLDCSSAGAGRFNFFVSDLGDVRNWSAGTFTMVATRYGVGVDYYPNSSQPAGPAGIACGVATSLEGMLRTVTVDTATGERAPYPKLVTDDFVRTFRLDFDTSSAQPRNGNGVVCDFALAAQVSLHLTQTAADYVYDTEALCGCE